MSLDKRGRWLLIRRLRPDDAATRRWLRHISAAGNDARDLGRDGWGCGPDRPARTSAGG